MSDDRKKPDAAFWTTVVLFAVLVVYPLSYGPACWIINAIANRGWLRPDTEWIRQLIFLVYWPIRRMHSDGPDLIRDALYWYAHLWS